MKYIVSDKIFETFPSTILGLVKLKEIENSGESEEINKLIGEAESEIKSKFSIETLSEHPKIASWRGAFRLFGAKPKNYQSSIENMYRMLLNGGNLRHINKVVDIYNYVSIKNTASLGGDDADKISGNVVLKFAKGDEPYYELNTRELKHPKEGEVIYVDDKHVLCRRWNWRQGDGTKIDENSKNVLLIIESLAPFTRDDVENIAKELANLCTKYCGGTADIYIIDKDIPEAEIS